nr:unknown [Populus trichocarpa]
MIGLVDEETSLQQSTLQELEMVMAQLNDKTRICFRDALYRLASNSKQHPIEQDQNGDLSMETPGTGEDEKMGSGGKTTVEMETNAIDRAIANLMFSKMDLNIRDFPVSAPVNSKQGISRETKPLNCRWNEPQGHDLPSYPNFRGDAEVPILGHGYRQIRANPGKHM